MSERQSDYEPINPLIIARHKELSQRLSNVAFTEVLLCYYSRHAFGPEADPYACWMIHGYGFTPDGKKEIIQDVVMQHMLPGKS